MELVFGLTVLILPDIAAWGWGVDSMPREADLTRTFRTAPRHAI